MTHRHRLRHSLAIPAQVCPATTSGTSSPQGQGNPPQTFPATIPQSKPPEVDTIPAPPTAPKAPRIPPSTYYRTTTTGRGMRHARATAPSKHHHHARRGTYPAASQPCHRLRTSSARARGPRRKHTHRPPPRAHHEPRKQAPETTQAPRASSPPPRRYTLTHFV